MEITARRYDTNQAVTIHVIDGCIAKVEDAQSSDDLPYVSAGLVDLQVNGFGGQEFNDPGLTPEMVRDMSVALDAHGVTSYCPTTTTHSFEMFSHAFATIAEAASSFPEVAARVAGIHLEGPYISKEDGPRGAHPLEHCRPPDWDEFQRLQEAAEGRICILTLSPEYDGSAEFISKVVQSGVLVAIGHTSANSDQIRAAVDAGARMSTHLGNGSHGQIQRHPNYIWDQLADDRLTASLIADGHHLPAEVVQCFVRGKTAARCVLVSDMTGMAGMPPGRYNSTSIGDVEVLEDGRLVVGGQRQYLAGAALPIDVGIGNIMRFADVSLATAIDMASQWPARLIGQQQPFLEIGSPADLIVFTMKEHVIGISATIKHGSVVFGEIS